MARTQPHDIQITFDAQDPMALGEFWAAVLGYVRESPPDFETWEEQLTAWGVPQEQWNSRNAIVDPEGRRPRIFIQQVPEAKTAKNRLHLDIRCAPGLVGEARTEALESECERVMALGATVVNRVPPGPENGNAGWIVMQDPEGNEFCLD